MPIFACICGIAVDSDEYKGGCMRLTGLLPGQVWRQHLCASARHPARSRSAWRSQRIDVAPLFQFFKDGRRQEFP